MQLVWESKVVQCECCTPCDIPANICTNEYGNPLHYIKGVTVCEGLGKKLDRANYVARMWKRADSQKPCDVGPVGHGCVLDAGTYKIQ